MLKAKLHSANKEVKRSSDVMLIVGDGDSMKRDVDLFTNWQIPHDVACLGRCVKHFDHCAHWFNGDGETAIAWVKQIKAQSTNGLVTHTLGPVDGFDVDWDMEQPDYHFAEITNQKDRIHGSSALFATLAGLTMGYSKIVLAGCPMDSEGHWYFEIKGKETLGPLWLGVDFMAWLDFKEQVEAERVRSMSGYTAKILGEAERGWLDDLR